MLRSFAYHPMWPLTRSSPSSPVQMTLTWGLPSRLMVLRWVRGPEAIRSRSSAGRALTRSNYFVEPEVIAGRASPTISLPGPVGEDTARSGRSTITKRKNDRARARRFGMDPAGFESLGYLHDTLSLPAPTLARLSDQIFDLHQQLAEAREDASIAHGVGLPT